MKACQNNGKQNIIWCIHQTYSTSIVWVSANLDKPCHPIASPTPSNPRRNLHTKSSVDLITFCAFCMCERQHVTESHGSPVWKLNSFPLLGSKLRTMDTDIQPCTYRIKILSSYSLQVFSNDFTHFLGFSSCIEMDPGYTHSSLSQLGLITAPSIKAMQRLWFSVVGSPSCCRSSRKVTG